MQTNDRELLRRLGTGDSIPRLCSAAGLSREQFDAWWRQVAQSRVPSMSGRRSVGVKSPVEIERDNWGIPHVFADNDRDLFFGLGLVQAQDRLFQLDYLRRKACGRLAEILGAEAVASDTIARTVGLPRIAEKQWDQSDHEVRSLLEAFTAGVNQVITDTQSHPPIEFDYRPEPWQPVDCLAIASEFRWYLTGRLPVIAIPELAKRALPTKELYEEFLLGEADGESILRPGDYIPAVRHSDSQAASGNLWTTSEPVGHVMNDPEANIGSNNWVLSGSRTTTGQPLLGSDPHIAFEAVSCWYEVHLCGGSFNVAGISYTGIPAVMFGRNPQVAWGITNNICSQRDLYQERTDPAHPDCFYYDGTWEAARAQKETIHVRGEAPVEKTIRFSRNGPIVDELLPSAAQSTGPVSLQWLGAYPDDWLKALLDMDRAENVEQLCQAVRPWQVPTFSLVIADAAGDVGFQIAGRIPLRSHTERGYRPGWDSEHQWQGVIPFDSMPALKNPPRGWIATANNRLAADDYPFPLSGCWSSGWRAERIRDLIESRPQLGFEDMRAMQQDVRSLRAVNAIPPLLALLDRHSDPRVQGAAKVLARWNGDCTPESNAAAIFNVFFTLWCRAVAKRRFEEPQVELMASAIGGCALRLLQGDSAGWFDGDERRQRVIEAFEDALSLLSDRFGADMEQWTWGRLHRMPLKHVLSGRGDLGELLNHGGAGVRGDMVTVCNSGSGQDWTANSGAGYRLVADLARQPPVLLAVDGQSQSGHPGSPHYTDQYSTWLAGDYHAIALDRNDPARTVASQMRLEP